jgi:hypothetical protein
MLIDRLPERGAGRGRRDVTIRNLGPRGLGATLADHARSFGQVASAFGLPPVDWNAPKSFTFRRRRRDGAWGWEIGLNVGRLWLNLTCDSRDSAPHVATLAEARAWAIGFAERHGFQPMEQGRPPRKKPRPRLRVIAGGGDGGGAKGDDHGGR